MRDNIDLHIAYGEYLEEKKALAALAGATAVLATSPMTQTIPQHEPVPKVQHKAENQDLKYLALTMWGEARDQGMAGMRAVGHVIMNRLGKNQDRWGDDVKDVVKRGKQFSCWNGGDPNLNKMKDMLEIERMMQDKPEGFDEWEKKFLHSDDYQEYKKYVEAKELAGKILANKDRDPTNGALFYHTTGVHPLWAKGQHPIAKISDHLFYKTEHKLKPKKA